MTCDQQREWLWKHPIIEFLNVYSQKSECFPCQPIWEKSESWDRRWSHESHRWMSHSSLKACHQYLVSMSWQDTWKTPKIEARITSHRRMSHGSLKACQKELASVSWQNTWKTQSRSWNHVMGEYRGTHSTFELKSAPQDCRVAYRRQNEKHTNKSSTLLGAYRHLPTKAPVADRLLHDQHEHKFWLVSGHIAIFRQRHHTAYRQQRTRNTEHRYVRR